jgi:thiol-disulfide isomerase/thioredoxin
MSQAVQSMTLGPRLRALMVLLCLTLAPVADGLAREELHITTGDDTDFTLTRFAADGEYLMLWILPEYGPRETHGALAEGLARRGVEVWQVNLLENLFMTQNAQSQRRLDGRYAAELAQQAHAISGKRIVISGDSYAAATALMAARQAQSIQTETPWLTGAVLFTPFTYASIPPLGQAPDFMPIVDATNIPLMIYQSRKSLTNSRFDELLSRLRRHGSPVYLQHMPNITSLFYAEPASEQMRQSANRVIDTLPAILPLLQSHPTPRQVIAMNSPQEQSGSGIDIYLRRYSGNVRASAIELMDARGHAFKRDDFSGQVTLINFWASWCPPCVEEIPSLNRLQQAMQGQAFELISVNYAEDPATVNDFMRKVNVEFPVLLDVSGDYARRWNVITYPSTFVLDKAGRIRYGVNAAIAWDDAQVVELLSRLASEQD